MGIAGIAKLWLAVRPIKRIKEARQRKKELTSEQLEIEPTEEKDMGFLFEVVKGGVRHGLTAAGLVLVNGGLATQDEVNVAVGAVMTLVGFGFSVYRKWRRSRES